MAYHGPGVVIGEVDDPVVPPERPEEAHFEARVGHPVDHAGPAPGHPLRPINGLVAAAVDHVDLAVGAQGVRRRGGGAPALKPLRKAGDVVPGADVPPEVDARHGLERRQAQALGGGGAAAEEERRAGP